LQSSRTLLRRASFAGAVAVSGLLFLPGTAHAATSSAIQPLPVIELKAKSGSTPTPSTPATTPTTAKPAQPTSNITIVTIPSANVSSSDAADDTSDGPAANDNNSMSSNHAGNPVSAEPVSNTSAESSSNLAFTGANITRLVGIGMVLTALGIALLGFTDARARMERFVLSLLPHRLSGE
jgi:hypothetical protein